MSGAGALFALNAGARVHVETIGEDCPVLVIDDVFADPDAIRTLALDGIFDTSLAYYPGVHAQIAMEQAWPLFTQLSALLGQLSGLHCSPGDFSSDFSLVTTPAKDMLAKQKHPHVDGIPLAGVVYLTPGSTIGTSFFRHLPLGLSMLRTDDEHGRYGEWLETEGERHQPATYAIVDSDSWQCLHTVEARYNRLVIYPGNAFHAIAMDDVAPGVTLDSARLTQRLFVRRLGAPA